MNFCWFVLEVDTSGDGLIDIKEFERLLEHPKLQLWLHQLEIETTDLVGLFNMLDDGDAWLHEKWWKMQERGIIYISIFIVYTIVIRSTEHLNS